METYDVIIIGGGAAGIFCSINSAIRHPNQKILVLERTEKLLTKVRISGGGRCNVTHACFDPKKLVLNYPRGQKELLGPFHTFQPLDTIKWFQNRGVQLKTEKDGRMFPTTDSSDTIISCLLDEARKHRVEIRTGQHIASITKESSFHIHLKDGKTLSTPKLVLATGSNKNGHALAQSFGHTIVEPVPSLFTFNIPDSPLLDLSGIAVPDVEIKIAGSKRSQRGPLLITHWGFSGPAALKLSAWEARELHMQNYDCQLIINWNPEGIESPPIPKKLWNRFLELCRIDKTQPLTSISNKKLRALDEKLQRDVYTIKGKTTNKEEFVTAGGVALKEVNFKTMESKKCPGLYFTGEILDIDGITGGFNFQNAWTTAWIASTKNF